MSKTYGQLLIPNLFKHPENIAIISVFLVGISMAFLPKEVYEDPNGQIMMIYAGIIFLLYSLYTYWLIKCLYSGKPCNWMGRLNMIGPLFLALILLIGVIEMGKRKVQ